ncbi:hypothetical protein K431DRAFT_234238 [Polychaeton citri CBS 116435]|uniref:RFX-type winged-helix domain-containing protein n=1 Tax=Polychaeton citri CBS 116435 TaxID=1314669 RepID=A0A9P4UL39_9PEZI|nr:hypothetical protein K431DRAFT_234238 [Polychaeton citri CBS 116435]
MPPSHSRQGSQRPDSRASTTSATSQQHDNTRVSAQSTFAQHGYLAHGPEAALLQYHQQIRPQTNQQSNYQPQQAYYGGQVSASFPAPDSYHTASNGLAHGDAQLAQSASQHIRQASLPVSISGITDGQDDKKKKGSAVTATNDKELREMLVKNEGRPLSDVAEEVKLKERTPFAEKTKQLFAMLWLRAVCKPAKTSVPRNRVYSQYATRCGTERVVPLNPASFGKLVRVIFPGIQTRRLGVRGESKYHYVDLALDEEPPNPYNMQQASMNNAGGFANWANRPARSDSASTQQINFNSMPRLQADTAAFPTNDVNFEIPSQPQTTPRGPRSKARSFAYPDTRGMQPGSAEAISYHHSLRFPSREIPMFTENEPVHLPPIQPYLPPRTNLDDAEALVALYRTHCTSLIDSLRFCKEKQFFRLYTTFHGTLTVPVQKLFTHPNLAPWIEQCDLIMYRTMVRFVSRLTLQAAPVIVINILANISTHLHGHIAKTFAAQPLHVLEAKLRPATVFASLLHRLIRVNQSAHAAANLLTIDQNREKMWTEWVTMVNPKRVMEAELPANCNFDEVHRLMTTEMRTLLEPLQSPDVGNSPYGFNPYQFEENGGFGQFMNQSSLPGSRNGQSQVSTETVLDRWSGFITSLPSRFPTAPARTLLHCISATGTAALRDITIMNGLSYGHWWVLKIFVDEMALWLAEMGGFLEGDATSIQSPMVSTSPDAIDFVNTFPENGSAVGPKGVMLQNGNAVHHQGFMNVNAGGSRSAQPILQAPFQPPPQQQRQMHHQQSPELAVPLDQHFPQQRQAAGQEADIDDSGIGMSMMEDPDFSLPKIGNRSVGLEGIGVA